MRNEFVCLLSISFWFPIWPRKKECVLYALWMPFWRFPSRNVLCGLSSGCVHECDFVVVADSSRFLFVVVIIIIMICEWMNGLRTRMPKTKIINHFFSLICFFVHTQLYLFIFYNHQESGEQKREREREHERFHTHLP